MEVARGFDAGKRIKGRKRHITVNAEGFPIVVHVHPANVQDRDGTPAVIVDMLEVAPTVEKLFAGGGYEGPKLRGKLEELAVSDFIEIVENPKGVKGFTVLYRRWVVERTVCLVEPPPPLGQGLRTDHREFHGMGEAGSLPVLDAAVSEIPTH